MLWTMFQDEIKIDHPEQWPRHYCTYENGYQLAKRKRNNSILIPKDIDLDLSMIPENECSPLEILNEIEEHNPGLSIWVYGSGEIEHKGIQINPVVQLRVPNVEIDETKECEFFLHEGIDENGNQNAHYSYIKNIGALLSTQDKTTHRESNFKCPRCFAPFELSASFRDHILQGKCRKIIINGETMLKQRFILPPAFFG